jgi:hypothetical protein
LKAKSMTPAATDPRTGRVEQRIVDSGQIAARLVQLIAMQRQLVRVRVAIDRRGTR